MPQGVVGFPDFVFGTYEEFIVGLQVVKPTGKRKVKLHQFFATHSHKASVRCVAAHGRYLLSSGADEYIHVYDMATKDVLTTISFHKSTVTCLEFVPDGTHFVSGNQDGDIAIFNCKDWTLVKYWKDAHERPNGVITASVHPSGGLLMTAGSDRSIKFWDLIRGRMAYSLKVPKKNQVGVMFNATKWSKTGLFFALCIGKLVEVNHTKSAGLIYGAECSAKITSMEFLSQTDNLILGLETGVIEIHNVKKKEMITFEKCHETRVKCMYSFMGPCPSNPEKMFNYLISADSKGLVKLWRLRVCDSSYTFILKACIDMDCRITCLTAMDHYEGEEEEEEEQEEQEEQEQEEGEEEEQEEEEQEAEEQGAEQ